MESETVSELGIAATPASTTAPKTPAVCPGASPVARTASSVRASTAHRWVLSQVLSPATGGDRKKPRTGGQHGSLVL